MELYGIVTDSEGPQGVHAHKLGAKESNHCSPTPQNAESPSVLKLLNVFRYLCNSSLGTSSKTP